MKGRSINPQIWCGHRESNIKLNIFEKLTLRRWLLGEKKQNNSKIICIAILENKRKKFWGEISISFVWCSITLFPNPNYSLETEKYWLNVWMDLTYNISTTSTYFWLCTYRNLTMWGKLFQYFNIIFFEFHHVKIFSLISLCRAAG